MHGSKVHQSLRGVEGISERQLAYFDEPEGAGMLYHMRMLPVSARPATAAYVADNALNTTVRSYWDVLNCVSSSSCAPGGWGLRCVSAMKVNSYGHRGVKMASFV